MLDKLYEKTIDVIARLIVVSIFAYLVFDLIRDLSR